MSRKSVPRGVWRDVTDTPQEAANMQARADLMIEIQQIIEKKGWTQGEAAEHCQITQPRASDLFRGRIDKCSLDALVTIASALGRRVEIKVKRAA